MKLLFDQGTPAPLRRHLPQHLVDMLAEKGWSVKGNGELLDLADAEAYDVLVTTDQSIRHSSPNTSNYRRRTTRVASGPAPAQRRRRAAFSAHQTHAGYQERRSKPRRGRIAALQKPVLPSVPRGQ